MSMRTGIILLGRGGYSKAPAEQMERLKQAVESEMQVDLVQGAFIDQGSPSLLDALKSCLDMELDRVFVMPVYLPTDRNLERWLAGVMKRWLHDHPQAAFALTLTEGIGDSTALDAALIDTLKTHLNTPQEALSKSPDDPNHPDWSAVPPHQYHVLFCRGPRCNTIGAGEIAARLSQRLQEKDLLDKDVLVVRTGCLYPCNLGPLMVVYPDGVWYGGLDEEAIDQIVEQHFIGGEVVERYVCYREQTRM